MTEYLEPRDVLGLIRQLGFHLRDRNLLLSALASPLPVFGQEMYPGDVSKAAALLIAVNRNHPLADGNKRLAWIVAKTFLALNGLHLASGPVAEGDTFIRKVADGGIEHDEVVEWIEARISLL
ncbi:type II toxin-antitoxin system death-on-curing family toxin [Leifsonia virtsii]|uniref:Type II toxin-antitoxin system death-on-curing family toxin n=1 Tax=Leifsonia virtsii TaxID=3035915 RepID=A0ABT8IZH8_9MICO|nr:type II toxin-antitoxin system death-on-curing family toxin [Leifsonia virtsii]MDN4598242.1 type II toxin-antitoxin system death-on-curing family toxin [Leifsonia virtsii]